MSSAVPIIRNDEDGERLWFYGGGVHVWKATSAETGGSLMLFENHLSQGKTTPLHVHPNEDEALYVLEGEMVVHIEGHNHRVGPRGFAFAPRGVPHAFLITSPEARILCLETPASAEAFYRGASEPLGDKPDQSGPVDFAKVRESAERSGAMQVLGPPRSIRRSRPGLALPSSPDVEPWVPVAVAMRDTQQRRWRRARRPPVVRCDNSRGSNGRDRFAPEARAASPSA